MRVSESAVQYYLEPKLDKETELDSIYGVCLYTGNMCDLAKDTMVWRERAIWIHLK